MKKTAFTLMAIFLCGCAHAPFKQISYVPVSRVDAQKIPAGFSQRLPERFELINSSVFTYRHMKFSCLGPARIDMPAESFTAIGMNQMGIKLFEMSFSNGIVKSEYVFPEIAKYGNFAAASGEDIKNMYLDRVPPAESSVITEKYRIIFRVPRENGFLDYVFAGKDNLLIEKNMFKNGRKIWSVFYYEYIVNKGKVFPAGIILKQYSHNYRLTVRLKEILENE